MNSRKIRCEATNVRPGDTISLHGNTYGVTRVESAVNSEAYGIHLVFTMTPARGSNTVLGVFKHGELLNVVMPIEEGAGFTENQRIINAVVDMINGEKPASEIVEFLADALDGSLVL